MKNTSQNLAISASALGAGILGLGIGILWGKYISGYGIAIAITGAVIHVVGMYLLQLNKPGAHIRGYAKMLWFSAWICLILIILLFIYFIFIQKA
ncbi:MAG: TRADD-N-associated membrane domain-containing protein [Bacteroidia bacterium]